ncbi:MAG: hypothetical protein AAFQ45_07245 [Pseudomonadota bacterium]
MTKKRATVKLHGADIAVDYVVAHDLDVQEWRTAPEVERRLTEEDCLEIDAQLFEIENGYPVYPKPTLKRDA